MNGLKVFMYTVKNTFLRIQKNILNRRKYEKNDQHVLEVQLLHTVQKTTR